MNETQIITDIIGAFGLFITLGVLMNAFKYQGQVLTTAPKNQLTD